MLVPLLLMSQRRVQSASALIIVQSLQDTLVVDGLCKLREAINNANSPFVDTSSGDCSVATGNDTIGFALDGTIALALGALPPIQNTLTIDGTGHAITISGDNSASIFTINSTATVVLNELTIQKGVDPVTVNGTLTISNSTFADNSATDDGAAVLNEGGSFDPASTLTITNSNFLSNDAPGSGGAISNERGTLFVSNSSFVGNIGNEGGAIANFFGVVSVTNSTFANNGGFGLGGGVYNGKNQLFVVSNSTFSGNRDLSGGNLYNDSGGVMKVSASIVADAASGSDCAVANVANPISDLLYNIDDDGSCGFVNSSGTPGANAQTLGDGVNPSLDPSGPQKNGGTAETIALQPTSVAIDAIPTSSGLCPATDERGLPRPDPGESGTAACDVGAFEFSDPTPTATATATSTATPTQTQTPIRTATATPTASATPTPTASATATQSSTATRTATPTPSATPTATATSTATPTLTATTSASPTQTATPSATATITSTQTATPTATPTPVSGKLKVSPKTLKFGGAPLNQPDTKMVIVTNAAKTTKKNHPPPILIEMEDTSGMPAPSPFSISTQCANDDLVPGGKGVPKSATMCKVAVQFKPTQAVSYSGTLTIIDDLEPNEMQTVQITGKGNAQK